MSQCSPQSEDGRTVFGQKSEDGRAGLGLLPWTRVDAVAALVLCSAQIGSGILALLGATPASPKFPGMAPLLASLLFFPVAVGALVVLRAAFSHAPLASFFGPQPRVSLSRVFLGLLLLVALVCIAAGTAALAQSFLKQSGHDAPLQSTVLWLLSPDTPLGAKILLSLYAVILAPLCEETLFRGILLSNTVRAGWGVWGILAVSLLFALCHGRLLVLLPLFLIGLVCGKLATSTGSILPGAILHAAFNAVNLVFVFLQLPGAA